MTGTTACECMCKLAEARQTKYQKKIDDDEHKQTQTNELLSERMCVAG